MSGLIPQYFGTDGIRDIAGEGLLSAESVRRWGRAIGRVVRGRSQTEPVLPVLLGRDTRPSGREISGQLAAGILEEGVALIDAGVLPTPAVSRLLRERPLALGVVVSASHNPAEYNGIKLLSGNLGLPTLCGAKTTAALELEVERRWVELGSGASAGRAETPADREDWKGAADLYARRVSERFSVLRSASFSVVLDCAFGAAFETAPSVLRGLGLRVHPMHCDPSAGKINEGCGALHPEGAAREVSRLGTDLGIVLDGDADRTVLVDERGEIRDGDDILAICAMDLHERRELAGDTVVGTVMNNAGLEEVFRQKSIRLLRSDVGDRHVWALMEERAVLGGEPSGHVIFKNWGPTGDGLVAALHVMEIMHRTQKRLSELCGQWVRFPQMQRKVSVRRKPDLKQFPAIEECRRQIEGLQGSGGRAVVRYSGTEPVARIMVEGPNEREVRLGADRLAQVVEREVNRP
jgi:phosphoglucosamine mutase